MGKSIFIKVKIKKNVITFEAIPYPNRIFNTQRKAVRMIDNAPYNAGAMPLLKNTKSLNFPILSTLIWLN